MSLIFTIQCERGSGLRIEVIEPRRHQDTKEHKEAKDGGVGSQK
jgi:hypothetical protein